MRVLFLISVFVLLLQAQNILVINSNSDVKKYTETVKEFSKSFNKPFKTLDLSNKSNKRIKEYLYDAYPDIVYAVGAKAYQYANRYIPEKEIYFSSIVDWKKLAPGEKRYGVSNELSSGMQLTLIKSIFENIKRIGVIHSRYTQNIVNDLILNAKKMGIEIVSSKIDEASVKNIQFDEIITRSDAIMIISDPLFLNNAKAVKELFDLSKAHGKPVFAYHELFIKHGATLVLSVDNQTIGRQIAAMIESTTKKEKVEKIQYPAGTKVIFNKKEALLLGVKFSPDTMMIATKVVE